MFINNDDLNLYGNLTLGNVSNSLKPVVRPSVRSSVRQNHLWALQPSAGARKKPPAEEAELSRG